jgi:hypothetical protein
MGGDGLVKVLGEAAAGIAASEGVSVRSAGGDAAAG